MSYRSLQYVVSGAVQGVGFRQFVKKVADRDGVVGWVKNDAVSSSSWFMPFSELEVREY